MRKIRWKAGRCPAVFPAVFTVDPGDWRGLEPDAIDTLDVAAQAKVWRDAVWRHGVRDNLSLVVAMIES